MTARRSVRFAISLLYVVPVTVAWAIVYLNYQVEFGGSIVGLVALALTLAGPAIAGAWWRGSGAAGASLGTIVGLVASWDVYLAVAPSFAGRVLTSYDARFIGLVAAALLVVAPLAALAGWFARVIVHAIRTTPTAPLPGPWNAKGPTVPGS